MLKKMTNNPKGFTLIELMIVVAIIGILAAIAIPQFSAYRVRAYNAAAMSDLKSLQTAFEMYFNDNEQYPPASEAETGLIEVDEDGDLAAFDFNTSNKVTIVWTLDDNGQTYAAASKHLAGDTTYKISSEEPTIQAIDSEKGTELDAVPDDPTS